MDLWQSQFFNLTVHLRTCWTNLDGLGINFQSLFLVYKKFLHNISLITLKLNHVASLLIVDDGTIAGKLLLDNLENLLQIEL